MADHDNIVFIDDDCLAEAELLCLACPRRPQKAFAKLLERFDDPLIQPWIERRNSVD